MHTPIPTICYTSFPKLTSDRLLIHPLRTYSLLFFWRALNNRYILNLILSLK